MDITDKKFQNRKKPSETLREISLNFAINFTKFQVKFQHKFQLKFPFYKQQPQQQFSHSGRLAYYYDRSNRKKKLCPHFGAGNQTVK